MQITLKQSEITAALAAYITNVLGASGVTPETLSVVYKQGRIDKNGLTAELEIEAPSYSKPIGVLSERAFDVQKSGELLVGYGVSTDEVKPSGETPAVTTSASVAPAPEVAPVEAAPEVAPVAELDDEVSVALAEDAAADAAEDEVPLTATASPLFV